MTVVTLIDAELKSSLEQYKSIDFILGLRS
jgi:hypothetical protein